MTTEEKAPLINEPDPVRKPLSTISNRKRTRSPNTNKSNKATDGTMTENTPPRKKQKTAASTTNKSTVSKKKRSSKTSSTKTKHVSVIRISDIYRFPQDADDDDDDQDDIAKSRKMKFSYIESNGLIYVSMSDLFRVAFKYKIPRLNEMKTEFQKKLTGYLLQHGVHEVDEGEQESTNRNQARDKQANDNNQAHRVHRREIYTVFDGKYFLSERGFCILFDLLFDYVESNIYVKHWFLYRYYYRKQLFKTKFKGIRVKKEHHGIFLCSACFLDDVEQHFYTENPCDCQCRLHLNCDVLQITEQDIKIDDADWFCPFCIGTKQSLEELKARREYGKSGEFEVEEVLAYDEVDDVYFVKWKNFPAAACERIPISTSFIESVQEFWRKKISEKKMKKIPLRAQTSMSDRLSNHNRKDTEQKTEAEAGTETETPEEPKYVAVKLTDIMDKKHIVHRQTYTHDTFARYKETKKKYKRWLQSEVNKESKIGMQVKHEMTFNKEGHPVLPKYHLRSSFKEWDCSLPRIRDIIVEFLSRDWKKWGKRVSQNTFVIGDILDLENPAKKCTSGSVHDNKAYGLFATQLIKKDSLLFEYAGCVKRIGDASTKLDHLERELDQTRLFDLVGHLNENRAKLFWGPCANDQLVIDPSIHHNEGVYTNDYRANVMDDPDNDVQEPHTAHGNAKKGHEDEGKDKASNAGRRQNIKFFEVLVNNWPRVFAVAICDIQPGEELLTDYGDDYWKNFRVVMQRKTQLDQIKQRIHTEWQQKYDVLQATKEAQEKEIETLKERMQSMRNKGFRNAKPY